MQFRAYCAIAILLLTSTAYAESFVGMRPCGFPQAATVSDTACIAFDKWDATSGYYYTPLQLSDYVYGKINGNVAPASHRHDNASSTTDGYMSSLDYLRLYSSTATINLASVGAVGDGAWHAIRSYLTGATDADKLTNAIARWPKLTGTRVVAGGTVYVPKMPFRSYSAADGGHTHPVTGALRNILWQQDSNQNTAGVATYSGQAVEYRPKHLDRTDLTATQIIDQYGIDWAIIQHWINEMMSAPGTLEFGLLDMRIERPLQFGASRSRLIGNIEAGSLYQYQRGPTIAAKDATWPASSPLLQVSLNTHLYEIAGLSYEGAVTAWSPTFTAVGVGIAIGPDEKPYGYESAAQSDIPTVSGWWQAANSDARIHGNSFRYLQDGLMHRWALNVRAADNNFYRLSGNGIGYKTNYHNSSLIDVGGYVRNNKFAYVSRCILNNMLAGVEVTHNYALHSPVFYRADTWFKFGAAPITDNIMYNGVGVSAALIDINGGGWGWRILNNTLGGDAQFLSASSAYIRLVDVSFDAEVAGNQMYRGWYESPAPESPWGCIRIQGGSPVKLSGNSCLTVSHSPYTYLVYNSSGTAIVDSTNMFAQYEQTDQIRPREMWGGNATAKYLSFGPLTRVFTDFTAGLPKSVYQYTLPSYSAYSQYGSWPRQVSGDCDYTMTVRNGTTVAVVESGKVAFGRLGTVDTITTSITNTNAFGGASMTARAFTIADVSDIAFDMSASFTWAGVTPTATELVLTCTVH